MRNHDKPFFSKFFTLAILVLFTSMSMASSIPNTSNNPRTFLGPSGSLSVTKGMSDNTAFSIGGEGGPKIIRLDGTLGWEMSYYQRIKVSGEYLREKLTYSFFDGRQSAWMNQGALGLDYVYDFHESIPYDTKIDLGGYVSHAPSRNLGTSNGTYTNSAGQLTNYSVVHRIAGSNAGGISPGVTIDPWEGTSAGFKINYDSVHYDTHNRRDANAIGIGGTVFITQRIVENVDLGLSAAVRAPFNDYAANISYNNVPFYGLWKFKVYGEYTIGKNTLPTTYDIGIGADYLWGATESVPVQQPVAHYKDLGRFKDQPRFFKDQFVVPPAEWEEEEATNKGLLAWTSTPAVRMPTVLTVADPNVTQTPVVNPAVCVPPSFSGTIADQTANTPYTVNVAPNFAGTNLNFTINIDPAFQTGNANRCASISSSGVITVNDAAITNCNDLQNTTVTASNACGTVTSNAFILFT